QENVFYYITLMNENYAHPPMPDGAEEGIRKGMYLLREGKAGKGKKAAKRVQLLGAGTILREVEAAADILREQYGIEADVWSVTSFNELRRDGMDAERWNMLHPEDKPRQSWVAQCLDGRSGPVVAATDYMKIYADQIRPYISAPYKVLGTDGFGRSDSRAKLREFFEVDRRFVTLAALKALADAGELEVSVVSKAMQEFGISADKVNPARA